MDKVVTSSTLGRRQAATRLACLAATLAMPHIARAAARTARIGHNNADASQIGQGGVAFASAVAADPILAPVLKIEVYGNAQLGDDVNLLKSCIKSTVDGALVASSIVSNIVRELGVVNAPYLFRDAIQARAVLDGAAGTDFSALCRAKDLPVIAWGENGVRHITSNKAVQNPGDLHALKIRVPQSEVMLNGFKALGASAAPLAFPLLREALRSGEFDAEENAISTIETAKLAEVQKYLCLTGHIYDAVGFIVSADLLEDLTEPQQRALSVCARKGAAVSRQVAEAAANEGVGRLRAAGMTVIDTVDIAAFKLAARPYLESLSATFGADRVKTLLEAGA